MRHDSGDASEAARSAGMASGPGGVSSAVLDLVTVAFNKPHLVEEQVRLLAKHLTDDFTLTVLDNSSDTDASTTIQRFCAEFGIEWWRPGTILHHEALNAAAARFAERGSEVFGFLDHDVYPERPTRLVPLIEEAGFLGVGQRTPASGRLYLWPGFCFFTRAWVAGRTLNFGGTDGGDTGSGLWPLFAEEDWEHFFQLQHGYRPIREPDSIGLQSWGYEVFGDWIHLTNGSGWMAIPNPEEREQLARELLAKL